MQFYCSLNLEVERGDDQNGLFELIFLAFSIYFVLFLLLLFVYLHIRRWVTAMLFAKIQVISIFWCFTTSLTTRIETTNGGGEQLQPTSVIFF